MTRRCKDPGHQQPCYWSIYPGIFWAQHQKGTNSSIRKHKTQFRRNYLQKCSINHDDVIKWKHFPRYWSIVRGIHRSPVNSPHKGQWRGALMYSLICVWINGWVNNRGAGDLRRYRAHCDVTVMIFVETLQILPPKCNINRMSSWIFSCNNLMKCWIFLALNERDFATNVF